MKINFEILVVSVSRLSVTHLSCWLAHQSQRLLWPSKNIFRSQSMEYTLRFRMLALPRSLTRFKDTIWLKTLHLFSTRYPSIGGSFFLWVLMQLDFQSPITTLHPAHTQLRELPMCTIMHSLKFCVHIAHLGVFGILDWLAAELSVVRSHKTLPSLRVLWTQTRTEVRKFEFAFREALSPVCHTVYNFALIRNSGFLFVHYDSYRLSYLALIWSTLSLPICTISLRSQWLLWIWFYE